MIHPSTLLLISSHPAERLRYQTFLSQHQTEIYTVVVCKTGQEALLWGQQMQPDVVVLDDSLTDLDGLQLLQQLQQQWEHAEKLVPIVMVGTGGVKTAVEAMQWGAQDYLEKAHLTAEVLIQAIAAAQHRIQWRQQKEEIRLTQIREQYAIELWEINADLERRVAERTAALQQAYQLVTAFFNAASAANIGLAIHDTHLRYVQTNEALARINGFSIEEHIGKTDTELLPKLAAEVMPLMRQVLDTGLPILNLELSGHQLEAPERLGHWLTSYFPIANQSDCPEALGTIVLDITDRKVTEETLRQSEQRFRTLFEATPQIAVQGYDRHRRVIYWNSASETLYGYTRREALGRQLEDLIIPATMRETVITAVESWVTQGIAIPAGELTLKHKNGSPVPVYSSHVMLTNTLGEQELYCVDIDLSERKKAEAALQNLNQELEDRVLQRTAELQQLQDRLQFILSSSPGVVYTCQAGGDFAATFVSDNVHGLFGYEVSDYTTNRGFWLNHIHLEDLPFVLEALETLFERGSLVYEYRFLHHDGTYRWVYDHSQLICDEQGHPIEIIGFWTDITERKQIEAERQQQEALIRSQKEFLTRLIDTVPNLIFVKDWDGRFQIANQATANVYHTTVENLIGKSDADFNPNGEEVLKFLAADREVMTTPQTKIILEETITSPTGEMRYFQTIKAPITSRDGKSRHVLGIATDITAHKSMASLLVQTNQQLTQANRELEQATRLKDEFLANMSHELRTPLNAILGITEGLRDEIYGELNERQHRVLGTVERSGQHLLELITDILDLSKIEAGKLELDIGSVSIGRLCQSSLAFIQAQAGQKQLVVTLNLEQPLPQTIRVDERRIRQVLINLLSNAVKFTPEGGSISLQVNYQANYVTFAVADSGIGIAPEHLNKLFKPFTQIDSSLNRHYSGTGLGLSLVQRLVTLHQGWVKVKSTPGVGSCFIIGLPGQQSD